MRCRPVSVFLALFVAARSLPAAAQADLAAERARMVATIETHAKQASIALGRDFIAPEILKVMGDVPRHEFVPDGVRGDAYADRPLPIGHGGTISQPFIVALMIDLLRVRRDDIVLEVGTGSGYQAAVLAHLARRVYTIEIVPPWRTALPRGYSGWAMTMSQRGRVTAIRSGRKRHLLMASLSLPRRAKPRRL
jgi:protein-L-isoaspartate(D-aspartate) O-methyltransferase